MPPVRHACAGGMHAQGTARGRGLAGQSHLAPGSWLLACSSTGGCRRIPPAWRRCVYGVKLLEDWRVLTADHSGHVRLWNCRELVGAHTPCLTMRPAFAPSRDDPALGVVNAEVGAGRMGAGGLGLRRAQTEHLWLAGQLAGRLAVRRLR